MPITWRDYEIVRQPWLSTVNSTSTLWWDRSTTATGEWKVDDRWATWTSTNTTDGWYLLGTLQEDSLRWNTMSVNTPSAIARAAIEATADEVAARRRDHADARYRAQSRADELLASLLTPQQWESYAKGDAFDVVGSHGTLYRIKRGVSGNVEWIRADGTVGGRLCAHPEMAQGWLPTSDVVLSQVLALTTDERAFLRVANVHYGSRPQLAAA